MKNKWKLLSMVLAIIIVIQGIFMYQVSKEKAMDEPEIIYYGMAEGVEVELMATRDFYRFQNAVNYYGTLGDATRFEPGANGKVFLWGKVSLFESTGIMPFTEGKATITTALGNVMEVELIQGDVVQGQAQRAIEEVYIYVNGTEDIGMEGITQCTLTIGEETFQVPIERLK